jgi:uncharacterized membrane protein YraQ (UPF0718 family)
MFNIILFILALLAVIYSYKRDHAKTKQALKIAYRSFINLLPAMLGIIGLIGLALVLAPGDLIAKLFGNNSPTGIMLISLIGSVTLIPAFIAFPLAASLINAGAGITAVACFITTLLMVGIITAPMEAEIFGKKFMLYRNGVGFALALIIGFLMGAILQ